MREIDEDLAISFAFSGAFRARLKSNRWPVLVASPTANGIFEAFRGGYTLEIDEIGRPGRGLGCLRRPGC